MICCGGSTIVAPYVHEEKSILAAAVGGYKACFVMSSKIVIN